jgi:predicted restriction endonuclease
VLGQRQGRLHGWPTRGVNKTTGKEPNFRNAVLQAYGYRCGVCGMDLRMDNVTVSLEAAHVQWHTA